MAAHRDLYIEAGATLSETLVWTDENGNRRDLTGYSARAQVRASYRATDPALTLDSDSGAEDADGLIDLGGENGEITLNASAAATEAITLRHNEGVWDVELTKGGEVIRAFSGKVFLLPDATR